MSSRGFSIPPALGEIGVLSNSTVGERSGLRVLAVGKIPIHSDGTQGKPRNYCSYRHERHKLGHVATNSRTCCVTYAETCHMLDRDCEGAASFCNNIFVASARYDLARGDQTNERDVGTLGSTTNTNKLLQGLARERLGNDLRKQREKNRVLRQGVTPSWAQGFSKRGMSQERPAQKRSKKNPQGRT